MTIATINIINAFQQNDVSKELRGLIEKNGFFRCQPIYE